MTKSTSTDLVTFEVEGTANQLQYGGGIVRIVPPGTSLPPGISESTHDLLQVWPVETEVMIEAASPFRVRCALGMVDESVLTICNRVSCTGGPPPPTLSTDPNAPNVMALPKGELTIGSTEIAIPDGYGPILCPPWDDSLPTSVAMLAAPLESTLRARGQTANVGFHVYNVSAPGHPLDGRVIAIPVVPVSQMQS